MLTPSKAAAKIWALVSGLPPNLARERQFVVLQCYVDGSGTGNHDLFVMAGYVASAQAWANFSREWQQRLDMRPPLPYFKMSEMGWSPERIERASWFYRVIEEHVSLAISCVIPVQMFQRCMRAAPWPAGIDLSLVDNPYYVAFHAMVNGLAHEQTAWGIKKPVDFIFDEESIRKFDLDDWYRMKIAATPEARAVMGDPPIYRNDITTLPLQAADLYAWWVRKWALEGTADGVKNLRFSWTVQRPDLFRLHMPLCEEDMKDQIARMLSSEHLAIASMPNPSRMLRSIQKREAGIKMTLPDPSSPLNWRQS